jgi:tRNA(adenine34) deaminase
MFNGKEHFQINFHTKFMYESLNLAKTALHQREIPVGAVIIKENRIIGKGYNQTETLKDPTAHAEMIAISAACSAVGEKYLTDCSIYVTLEPCPMCAGAIIWSKMKRVVFGAADEKSGACGTIFNLAQNKHLNHKTEVIQGVLESECSELLKNFFSSKR